MKIYGKKEEWHFVYSMLNCSKENCNQNAVVSERWSGRKYCQKHMLLMPRIIECAQNNLIIYNNNYDIKSKKEDFWI